MKGFVLCVAVIFGVLTSSAVFAQEVPPQLELTTVDNSIISPEFVVDSSSSVQSDAVSTTSSCGSSCCKQQTLVGASKQLVSASRHVAQKVVARSRCVTKTLWSKRPHLMRRCKCCR